MSHGRAPSCGNNAHISPEEIPGSCPVLSPSFGSWKGLTAIFTVPGWNQWETKYSPFCTEWSYFLHSSKKLLQINAPRKNSVMAHEEWALGESSHHGWGVISAWSSILPWEHPTGAELPCFPCTEALGLWARATLSVCLVHNSSSCICPFTLTLFLQQEAVQAAVTPAELRNRHWEPRSWVRSAVPPSMASLASRFCPSDQHKESVLRHEPDCKKNI